MKRTNEVFNFITILLIVSYNYLRMLGMNSKIVLTGYVIILFVFMLLRLTKIKFTRKQFFIILLFIVLSIFSIFVVDEVDFFIPVLAALTFLKSDNKKIVKYFFIISIIWFLIIISLYLLGTLKDNGFIRIENGIIKNRYNLGFGHVNQPFLYFLPIVFCLYLLCAEKRMMINCTVLIISTILFLFTDCRTGYFCMILFLILYNIPAIVKNKLFTKLFMWIFILFTILSIFITVKYGQDGSNSMNNILSLRPFYINKYIQQDNLISIKGGNFTNKIPLDNLYIYLLEEKGIILYMAYAIIYIYSAKIFKHSINYKTIMTIFLVYGLFEAYIILPSINFILIIQIKNIILANKEKDNFIEENEDNGRKNINNNTSIQY